MVTSDEPVYVAGSHGIRIENIMVCVEGETTQFGEFLKFDNLTVAVPIDTRPLIKIY